MQPTIDPAERFRSYLVSGDHWRAGKSIVALRRHQEGYNGPMHHIVRDGAAVTSVAIHDAFIDHMDHELVADRRLYQRWSAVELALREVEGPEGHEAVSALRYFLVPEYRRRCSVREQATQQNVAERTLWDLRDRAVVLVWEEVRLAGRAGLWAAD